eukprot:scaffold260_cov274-Pinguiococcus_pyrenoidosus.AAC.16
MSGYRNKCNGLASSSSPPGPLLPTEAQDQLDDATSIGPGKLVWIQGLGSRKELNGCTAEVVKRSKKHPDRWQIRLADGEIVLLKDSTLVPAVATSHPAAVLQESAQLQLPSEEVGQPLHSTSTYARSGDEDTKLVKDASNSRVPTEVLKMSSVAASRRDFGDQNEAQQADLESKTASGSSQCILPKRQKTAPTVWQANWDFRAWQERQRDLQAKHRADQEAMFERVLRSMLPEEQEQDGAEGDSAYARSRARLEEMKKDLSWMSPAVRTAWERRQENERSERQSARRPSGRRPTEEVRAFLKQPKARLPVAYQLGFEVLAREREALRNRFAPGSEDTIGLDPLGDASPNEGRNGNLLHALEMMQRDIAELKVREDGEAPPSEPKPTVAVQHVLHAFDEAEMR